MIDAWTAKLPGRETLSPCVGCWHDDQGLWFHLWAYADLLARDRIRAEAVRRGVWPPPASAFVLDQRNMILLPAVFSPLQ